MTCVLCFLWKDPVHIVLHAAAAAMIILFSAFVSSGLILRQVPFSQPLGRGEMLGPIAPIIAVVGSCAMTLGGIHYLATANQTWFVAYLILLGVITIGAYVHSRKVIRRRCNLEWFHE